MSMPLYSIIVTGDHAVPVQAPTGGTVQLTVDATGGTVYYADNPQVSAASNQGSIAPSGTATVSGLTYIRGSAAAGVTVQVNPLSLGAAQTIRAFNAGAFTASQQRDIVLTWPTPFVDANYTVFCMLHDIAGTANASAFRQVQGAKSATGFTLRMSAGTTGYSSGQLLIDAIGIHD